MDRILQVAQDHKWRVIEDAAHAFGSFYCGRRIGSFGDLTCFSFDPIKNITCGEGGAVVTRDPELSGRLRRKRVLGITNVGWARFENPGSWMYDIGEQGYRYHMSNINAAIGLEQLKKFEQMNARKLSIARQYDVAFNSLGCVRPLFTDYRGLALFLYVIRVADGKRDDLMRFLKSEGVDSSVNYIPSHYFSYYRSLAQRPLPVTEKGFNEILSLPLHPGLSDLEVTKVIESVQDWANGG
jgi:perosamine synthetase